MSAHRSAKDKTKRSHEGFFTKLFDTLQSKRIDSAPSVPPKLPQEPVRPDFKRPDPLLEQNVLSGFSKLSISDNPQSSTSTPSNTPFIGGFDPRQISSDTYIPGPSHTRPMAMPVPQSLTMQMALEPVQDNNNLLFCAQSNQLLPSPRPQTNTSSITSSPARSAISLKPNNNKSDLSISSAQSTKSGGQRCAGVTKSGKQCSRMVKTGYTLLLESEDADGSTLPPRFCFQHTKEIMSPSGYYSRKNVEWVKFEDWIPSYLQAATQVSLRIEMEKARSQSDVPGYIYTFEIRETRELETIKLKVGRAVNLVKRIDQWGKQCGSKEQVLRGFYPGVVEPDKNAGDGSTSLMKGRVIAGEKGPWCHRLERLIHIELSDLTCTCVYLDPSWPKIDTVSSASPGAVEVKASTPKGENGSVQPCVDCGSIHKEIFEFRRWKQGKNKGKEWDNLVKPVVERWGKSAGLIKLLTPVQDNMEDLVATTPQSTQNPDGGYGNDKEADAKRAQEEQMRRDLLATVLDTAARERLSRIALVSPDRSKQIETILLRMAQSGQLKNRVTEEQLIDLLNQMEQAEGKTTAQKPTIVYHRRKGLEDDLDF